MGETTEKRVPGAGTMRVPGAGRPRQLSSCKTVCRGLIPRSPTGCRRSVAGRLHCRMSDFRKLEVWKKAHTLAVATHDVAMRIRGGSYLSLRSQIIRASMSIPANIVEGCDQKSRKDFARFLRYSIGSTSELESHLEVAKDVHVVTEKDFDSLSEQLTRVRKMLTGLLKRVDS